MTGHATGGEGLFVVIALPALGLAVDVLVIVYLATRHSIGRFFYWAASALLVVGALVLGPGEVWDSMTESHLAAPYRYMMMTSWASVIFFAAAPLMKRIAVGPKDSGAQNTSR